AGADREVVDREGEGDAMTPDDAGAASPRVRMRGISVEFGPVQALHDVDLTLRPGEIHALMGDNGAAESTLVDVLAGVVSSSAGRIEPAGRQLPFLSAADAQSAGIAAVMQDVALARHLSIGDNVMLGHEPHGRWGIRWNQLHDQARQMLTELG